MVQFSFEPVGTDTGWIYVYENFKIPYDLETEDTEITVELVVQLPSSPIGEVTLSHIYEYFQYNERLKIHIYQKRSF